MPSTCVFLSKFLVLTLSSRENVKYIYGEVHIIEKVVDGVELDEMSVHIFWVCCCVGGYTYGVHLHACNVR
jgi:hypothetical protein